MLDVLGARVRWDVQTAIDRLEKLEQCRLLWIEKPLPTQDYQAHVLVKERIRTRRVGTGEQEWNVEGYRRLLEAEGVDVVQMAPGRCQGSQCPGSVVISLAYA